MKHFPSVHAVLLTAFLTLACTGDPPQLEPPDGGVGQFEQDLTADQATRLMAAARAAIGASGGQCKIWVQNIVSSTLGITVPPTAANQLEWTSSAHAVVTAQWRATYAIRRYDQFAVNAHATWSGAVSVPNTDPYVLVVYGDPSLQVRVVNGVGVTVAGPINASSLGVVSSSFTGPGAYSVRVVSSSSTSQVFTAVALSRSRFESDFRTARRGDAMQMYMYTSPNGTTPHTTLVQNDYNDGTNNWIDSNFVAANQVGQHTVTLDQLMRWTARNASYGFTVYRLQ